MPDDLTPTAGTTRGSDTTHEATIEVRIIAADEVVAHALLFYETVEYGERTTGRRYTDDRAALFAAAKAYADAYQPTAQAVPPNTGHPTP